MCEKAPLAHLWQQPLLAARPQVLSQARGVQQPTQRAQQGADPVPAALPGPKIQPEGGQLRRVGRAPGRGSGHPLADRPPQVLSPAGVRGRAALPQSRVVGRRGLCCQRAKHQEQHVLRGHRWQWRLGGPGAFARGAAPGIHHRCSSLGSGVKGKAQGGQRLPPLHQPLHAWAGEGGEAQRQHQLARPAHPVRTCLHRLQGLWGSP